jgi:hypothetical protein
MVTRLTTAVDMARQPLTSTGNTNAVYRFQNDAERLAGATQIQDVNEDGVPLWDIEALFAIEQFGKTVTEVIQVRVPSLVQPNVEAGPVRFIALSVTTSINKKGAFVAYWAADGIEPMATKSLRTSDHATP